MTSSRAFYATIVLLLIVGGLVAFSFVSRYREEAERVSSRYRESQLRVDSLHREVSRRDLLVDSLREREEADRILFESYLDAVRDSKGKVQQITDRYEKVYLGLDTLGPVELRLFITNHLEHNSK